MEDGKRYEKRRKIGKTKEDVLSKEKEEWKDSQVRFAF